MDSCSDLFASCPQDSDVEEKKKKRIEWQEGPLVTYFNLIESRIQAAGGKGVVKAASVADLVVKGVAEGIKNGYFDYVDPKVVDGYPGILYVQIFPFSSASACILNFFFFVRAERRVMQS